MSIISIKQSGELACTYAALILHYDGQEITEDKINAVVKGAGLTIEPYWANLYAKFLATKPIEDLISNVGGGGGGGGAGAGAAAAGDAPAAAAVKEEVVEEEEEDMGFDLFD